MVPYTLLVAEDNLDDGKLLQYATNLVYKNRVRYLFVYTVSELYAYLSVEKPVPDLLLLDYHLKPAPYTAPEVLKWLKEQDHLQDLVVDVWSAFAYGSEAETCLNLGARRFFSKSDVLPDIIPFVKQLVEGDKARNV